MDPFRNCWINIAKIKTSSNPENLSKKVEGKKDQLYDRINIEAECGPHHRQPTKEMQRQNISPLLSSGKYNPLRTYAQNKQ